jgi:hypothetical protein
MTNNILKTIRIKYYNKVGTYSSNFSARKHFVLELFSVIFVASFLWFFLIVNNSINFWSENIKIFGENGNKFKRNFFLAIENYVTNQCSSLTMVTKPFSKILVSTSSITSSRNVAISNCLLAGCMSRLYYSTLIFSRFSLLKCYTKSSSRPKFFPYIMVACI